MCPLALGSNIFFMTKLGAMHIAMEIEVQPGLWSKIYRQILKDKERISTYLNDALTGAINTTMAAGMDAFENPDMIREITRERFKYTF